MNLLLEIGCEELPSTAIQTAADFLPVQLQKYLHESRITQGPIESFATPRRILLLAQDLNNKQSDIDTEILGPKVQIAYDASGNLTQAGLGFLKARQIDPQNAYMQNGILSARVHQIGQPTLQVLSELLPKLILEIPFTKTMCWESSGTRFARPIRWILCLLDKDVVPFEIAHIKSGSKSCGHRFLSPKLKTVTQKSYFRFLEQNHVMWDAQKRQEVILKEATALAQSVRGQLKTDPALLQIVSNLVEYPWLTLGHFDPEYLKIPQEILICEMREHQKYFSILDSQGKLMPYFIVIEASPAKDPTGHERVLKARFDDGSFYYQEDLKKKLCDFLPEAPKELMHWVPILQDKDPLLSRAAFLCKADLHTGVVSQFPELQGVMGSIYARKEGENPAVCTAIQEHYWPRFAGDQVPSTRLGALLGLADRLTTLHIRKLPKGSADPYGLRRAAIGFNRIILEHQFQYDLRELITNPDILDFVIARARGVFLDNYPVLLVDATFQASQYNLCAWQARIQALENFDYEAASAVFKRVSNIVSKTSQDVLKQGSKNLIEPCELTLQKAIQAILITEDFGYLLNQLSNLKPLLDQFFDKVMVMTEDRPLRQARINLLAEIQKKVAHVADFSKLVL